MTITYGKSYYIFLNHLCLIYKTKKSCYSDSKKHFDVILSITGTVWPNVMPLCLVNTFVTIVVYVLRELDVVDVTFDPAGHSTMSIMVGFLVVSRVCAAYNRFWEARTWVFVIEIIVNPRIFSWTILPSRH